MVKNGKADVVAELKGFWNMAKIPNTRSLLKVIIDRMSEEIEAEQTEVDKVTANDTFEAGKLRSFFNPSGEARVPRKVSALGSGEATTLTIPKKVTKPSVVAPMPKSVCNKALVTDPTSSSSDWKSITKFYYHDKGFNKSIVNVYIDIPGIGLSKDRVICKYMADGFDLKITDHNGLNYRMSKQPLEKDIVPEECQTIVKKDQIKLKLKKKKGQHIYELWDRLTPEGGKRKEFKNKQSNEEVQKLMQDFYKAGDDRTKNMIGDTMSRHGL